MEVDRICYNCKHCHLISYMPIEYRCKYTGKEVESFNSCLRYEDAEE